MRMVLMAALIACSAPAFASASDSKAPPAAVDTTRPATQTASAEDPANQKICKRVVATESRLAAKKLCLTAEQWKERDEENASY